jgi:hypothetical protein
MTGHWARLDEGFQAPVVALDAAAHQPAEQRLGEAVEAARVAVHDLADPPRATP